MYMCVHVCVYMPWSTCGGQRTTCGSCKHPKDQTQVIKPGKHLYPWSHLTGPGDDFINAEAKSFFYISGLQAKGFGKHGKQHFLVHCFIIRCLNPRRELEWLGS